MIIELPNILDRDTCEEFIEFYENNPHLRQTDDAQQRFNGCTLQTQFMAEPMGRKIRAVTSRLLTKAAQFYHLPEVYLDYQTINRWDAGQEMPMHADNVDQERNPHWYCSWRDYSSVLYLNHDYEGGETVFKHQQQRAVPTQGTAILFPATYGYTHGVSEVLTGKRYTLSSWFTMQADHCQ